MKTTISIHIPLTQEVLDGLDKNEKYNVQFSDGTVTTLGFHDLKDSFNDEDAEFILIERSFTEDEINDKAKEFSPESHCDKIFTPTIRRLQQNAYKIGFKSALSVPKEKGEGE